MSNHINRYAKANTVVLLLVTGTLIFTFLVVSDNTLAQPSNFNKLTKFEKCESGDLPPSACKKASDGSQGNSGVINTGQTGGNTAANTGGSGNGAETESPTDDSNIANSAINQNQESTQICATGNVKVLPHSTIICNNNADLDQANNGDTNTDQTTDNRSTKP